jgi:plastocyanin
LKARDAMAKRLLSFGAAVALLLGSLVAIGMSDARAHEGTPHPAHIHTGGCGDTLGEVVYPLNDVGMAADGEMMGSESAIPVDGSVTTVEAALADIVGGEHAINVHESADAMGNYIACGAVGGTMMGESDLAIGLGEQNDSGYSGVAWLHDNGDGTTDVSVFLTGKTDGGMDHDMGTPDDSADDASAGGETVEVAIQDFAFGDPLEITVGTTVTWTNMDSAPHTATSSGNFQSDRLDQGASYSFTFEEAGTFDYFCEFHPNMTSTITVTE